jgi:hypothetical protein
METYAELACIRIDIGIKTVKPWLTDEKRNDNFSDVIMHILSGTSG